jgi:hypothetical protein
VKLFVIKDLIFANDSFKKCVVNFLVIDKKTIYSKESYNILRMNPFSRLILILKRNFFKQYNKIKILLFFYFLPKEVRLFNQIDLQE